MNASPHTKDTDYQKIYAILMETCSFNFIHLEGFEFSCNTQSGKVGLFVLLKFENNLDGEINHFNFNSYVKLL